MDWEKFVCIGSTAQEEATFQMSLQPKLIGRKFISNLLLRGFTRKNKIFNNSWNDPSAFLK